MNKTNETKATKKLSVKQAQDTARVIAEMHGLKYEEVFEGMVSKGQVSAGRGCYTEAQELFNKRFEEMKAKAIKEIADKGLELVNSKGQAVDVALNHKAVK